MTKLDTKPIKQITKLSDLEEVKPLEKVEVNHYLYYESRPMQKTKGIYGGSFDINDKKYFVIAETEPSLITSLDVHAGSLFVISHLYTKNSQDNLVELTGHHSFCVKSTLESTMKGDIEFYKSIIDKVDCTPNPNKQNKK